MTPLAEYLENNPDVTAKTIGERMAKHMGQTPSSSSLSQWRTGLTAPNAACQLAMAKATNNKVTPTDWVRWSAARRQTVKRG